MIYFSVLKIVCDVEWGIDQEVCLLLLVWVVIILVFFNLQHSKLLFWNIFVSIYMCFVTNDLDKWLNT